MPTEALGTVGRYQLEAVLGRGGMGVVFRASDPELDRPVAIKLVQAVPFARYDKLSTRLLREAKVLAKLTHPNVVRVYDCGQHEGEVYLAMELVEGANLRDWQQGQSRRAILEAYQQAARGLAAAHDLGITHRDFKPDNVLVAGDGRVLVGDFGLAGVLAGDELRTEGSLSNGSPGEHVSATRTGELLGTPAYMAPEQLRGKMATPLSDQFAFCVSLWEALTGLRPFEGEKREELLEEIERGRVRGSEQLPRRLRGLLLRGLAVEPKVRFDQLRELAEALVPRRGRVVIVAALSVSLSLGLMVGKYLPGECEPPALLDEIEATLEWRRVQGQPDNAELVLPYDRLRGLFESMRDEADDLCRPANNEELARQERLEMRIKYFRALLESPVIGDPEKILGEVDFLEGWAPPPPRPVDGEVMRHLQESDSLRLHGQLESALQEINQAVTDAGDQDLELALAYQWKGRVVGPLGGYLEAMDAYREAEGYADAAGYDDARLESELLAAEIAVMRLGDLARARHSLKHVHRLLRRLQEPWLSLRWAGYYEVLAAVLKREGKLDDALTRQERAISIRIWWGDEIEMAMGYLNLGTIYEQRGLDSDSKFARLNYERALQILKEQPSSPEWCEAAFNLGHWLVQYGGPDEEAYAKDLLQQVRERSEDLRPSALTELVLLELYREEFGEARSLAQELENSLTSDASSSNSALSEERLMDAWGAVATAHSRAPTPELGAFENARSSFERAAQALLANASPAQTLVVRRETAALDLTAAIGLQKVVPARALALATSARDLLLQLPDNMRPTDMLEAAEGLISELLRTSTSPATHP